MIKFKNIYEKKEKVIGNILLFFIIAQGLAIFLINLLQTDTYLFSDNTLAIRHGIEIWRKGIFLENFNYYSTLEIDNAAFLAIPLYFLTGNLGLSLGIVHVVLYVFTIYLICSIFKNSGYDTKYGYLAGFFLFTPYVIGGLDWGNMLFVTVGQYEFRVIVMLSIINLLIIALSKKDILKEHIPLLILNMVLCFWTTLSCGNYVLLMIVLPLCLFFVFITATSNKLDINRYALLILLSTILSCLFALKIRDNNVGETSRGNLFLQTADGFSDNIMSCITGFFMLFGGLTGGEATLIFSRQGIVKILKFIFICSCLILTYFKLKKLNKSDYLHYMFIFIALVNLAVMILSITWYGADIYEYRYHIIWGAMLLIVTAASFDSIKYVYLKRLICIAAVGLSVLINIGGFDSIFDKTDALAMEKETIKVANENDVDIIYFYNMPQEAAAIRVLDYDKKCMSVSYVTDHVFASTENYFEEYALQYDYEGEHLFVCDPNLLETIPEEIMGVYKQIGTLNGLNLYIGSENPWI